MINNKTYQIRLSETLLDKAHMAAAQKGTKLSKVLKDFIDEFAHVDIIISDEIVDPDIFDNYKRSQNASEQDLIDANNQYKDIIKEKYSISTCVDACDIEQFRTISGCFCKKCGFVYPF